MKGKRILVTGATGFLASHLIPRLVRAHAFVVALVRDFVQEKMIHQSSDAIVRGACEDRDIIARTIAEYDIDTIVHLAAQTQVSTAINEPISTFRTNIEGTWSILESARCSKTIKRIVIASSDKSYGAGDVPYSEDCNGLAGGAPYETSKSCADLIAQSYARTYGMSIGITRCGNLYGPGHLNWSTLIPGTIRRIFRKEPPVIAGDGMSKRDFLFIDDAVDAYCRMIESDYVGPINFGTDVPTTVFDVISTIKRIMKSTIEPRFIEASKHEIRDQWLHSEKARTVLKWEAKTKFRDGLINTIPWYVDRLETE